MLSFDWDNIPEQGLTRSGDIPVEEFATLATLQDEGVCRFEGPLSVCAEVSWLSGMLRVSGSITCRVSLSCSRCLKGYPQDLSGSFDLTFVRELPDISGDDEEGYELSADDLGLVHVPGEVVDLHDAFAEQVVMSLPVRPLCGEECAGLCPRCGSDLNQGDCGCAEEVFDTRFAALKNLKIEKD